MELNGKTESTFANLDELYKLSKEDSIKIMMRNSYFKRIDLIKDRIIKNKEEPTDTLEFFDILRKLIKVFHEYRKVLEFLDEIEKELFSMPQVPHLKGLCYLKLEDYTNAIPQYEKAIKLDSNNIWSWMDLVVCYTSNGDYSRALEIIVQLSKKFPKEEAEVISTNSASRYEKKLAGISSDNMEDLINLFESNLRAITHSSPKNENEVQNNVETILYIMKYKYIREGESISYSGKFYKPDFTLPSYDCIIEVKFCDNKNKISGAIDGINADIPAYQLKHKNLIFLIYDVGIIRDEKIIIDGIESNNSNVRVVIIKH